MTFNSSFHTDHVCRYNRTFKDIFAMHVEYNMTQNTSIEANRK